MVRSWWGHSRTIQVLFSGCMLLFPICVPYIGSSSVWAQSTPLLGASPTRLYFTAVQGGANPATQYINVYNSAGGTLSWSSTDSSGWLTAVDSGTNSGTIPVKLSTSSLAAGSYSGTVTIKAAGYPSQTKLVPVYLTVSASSSASSPRIGYSPTSLSFSGTVGGTNPAAKSISISNTGGGTLSWTISEKATWLSVSPTSGTNARTVTASANISGLAAGTYNGTITISATGATNNPRTILVSLTVSPATTTKKSVTLTWTASVAPDLAGYKIYRATSSGAYGAPIATLGKTTSYSATSLSTGTTYFFVITAYDSAGNESSYSNEVSKSIY